MSNPRVIWTGRATRPELAVPCSTCNATIAKECEAAVFPLPHQKRAARADVFGFRLVADAGPLFEIKRVSQPEPI